MSEPIVEVCIKADSSGERFGLWRIKGAANLAWRYVALAIAERGIQTGVVEIPRHGRFQCEEAA